MFLFGPENGESEVNQSPCIFSVMKTNQMVEIKDGRKKQIGGARAKMIPNVGREGSCEIFLHRD